MNFPIILRLLVVGLALSSRWLAPAHGAGSMRTPFVERVKPDDFYEAEKTFPENYSRSHELVVLRTTAAKPVSVLALQRSSKGEDYTLTLQLASSDAPDGWLKISEDLDAAVAKQVLRAVEFKLHRQVALSDFKRTMSKTDSDLWMFQRLADNRVAAALISMETTLDNPPATAFIDDFLGSLQRLIGTEGEARNELLQKIDRTATEIILSETR